MTADPYKSCNLATRRGAGRSCAGRGSNELETPSPQRSTAQRPPSATRGLTTSRPGRCSPATGSKAIAGRGGMGVVYKATQLGLERPVAMKVVAAGLLGDSRVRERFLREARAAAAIEHPNVGSDPRRGRAPRTAAVHRHALRRRRRSSRARQARRAARIHAGRESSRRSPPRSTPPTRPGSSTATSSRRTSCSTHTATPTSPTSGWRATRSPTPDSRAPGAWVGTLDFMAPEQIRGERIDGRVDVYALGCVLHFAAHGAGAYPRETDEARLWAHLHAVAPAPSRAAADVPAAFDDVVARALAKQPEGRPPSAGALGAAALTAAGGTPAGRILAGRTRGVGDVRDAPPHRRPLRRVSRAVMLVAASAAAGAGGCRLVLAGNRARPPLDRGLDGPDDRRHALRAPPARPAAVAPHVAATVRVARGPINVEVAGGSAWVASPGNPTLGRVSTSTNHRRPGPRLGLRDHGHRIAARDAVGHRRRAAGGRPGPRQDRARRRPPDPHAGRAARHRRGRGRGVGRRAVAHRGRQPRPDRSAQRHGRRPPGRAGGDQRHPRRRTARCGSSAAARRPSSR